MKATIYFLLALAVFVLEFMLGSQKPRRRSSTKSLPTTA